MLANYTSTGFPPSAFYSYPQTLSLNPSLLHTSSTLASANPPLSSPPSSSSSSSTQLQIPGQPTQVQLQHSSNFSSPSGTPSRTALSSVLNGLLSAKALISPNQIVRTIATMGAAEVELPMRLQVLSKIRDCAGNDFYQAWAQNTEAMDIIREWLKNAVMSKTAEWEETIMPLLHVRIFPGLCFAPLAFAFSAVFMPTFLFAFCNQVIDRLPLTVESLRSSKIGKVIIKLKEISTSSGELIFSEANIEVRQYVWTETICPNQEKVDMISLSARAYPSELSGQKNTVLLPQGDIHWFLSKTAHYWKIISRLSFFSFLYGMLSALLFFSPRCLPLDIHVSNSMHFYVLFAKI